MKFWLTIIPLMFGLFLLMLETFSVDKAYVYGVATVKFVDKVEPSFLNNYSTLSTTLQFDDCGEVITEYDKGLKPGDRVVCYRIEGTRTLFGIFGEYSFRKALKRMNETRLAAQTEWRKSQ